jgi:hypothetical protein
LEGKDLAGNSAILSHLSFQGNNLILTCKAILKTASAAEIDAVKAHKTKIGKKNVGSSEVTWDERMVLNVTDIVLEELEFQVRSG